MDIPDIASEKNMKKKKRKSPWFITIMEFC